MMSTFDAVRKDFVILLVEDNPDHAELVQRSFSEHGLAESIRWTTDGEAALDYLYRRGAYADPASSPRPDIVLLDLRLPKVDGLVVLKTIKEDSRLRRVPVIVLTTSDAELDLLRAYDSHVNSYLVKPVDFDRFIRLAHELGVYWRDMNRSC